MVKSPVNLKKANKQAKIYFPEPALLLCSAHKLNMKCLIAMLLMSTQNSLLCFIRLSAGSTPKILNKNLQRRTLPGFIIIFLC